MGRVSGIGSQSLPPRGSCRAATEGEAPAYLRLTTRYSPSACGISPSGGEMGSASGPPLSCPLSDQGSPPTRSHVSTTCKAALPRLPHVGYPPRQGHVRRVSDGPQASQPEGGIETMSQGLTWIAGRRMPLVALVALLRAGGRLVRRALQLGLGGCPEPCVALTIQRLRRNVAHDGRRRLRFPFRSRGGRCNGRIRQTRRHLRISAHRTNGVLPGTTTVDTVS